MALYNTTTKDEFEERVLKSSKVVLVDFWAEWCAPCRAMAPALHKLAETLESTLDVVKINIEDGQDNAALAGQYGVQSIPNMHVFKNGRQVDQIIGMMPAPILEERIKKHL